MKWFVLSMACLAAPAAYAQTEAAPKDCAAQAAMVMEAVNARVDGAGKVKTRRALRAQLDKTAADMLADWIYTLPEDQLTDAVGEAWKTQCEAL